MATLADLRAIVLQLLQMPGVAGVLQLNSNTRERAFEIYVFALVLTAVRQAGGTVELRGITSGPNPNPMVFRGAPGHMGSRAQDFCYARCALNGRVFEIHVDVQYEGTSGATHEVDVSMYDSRKAQTVRATAGALPGTVGLYGVIECKCYDSQLDTGLGRAFVGLIDDCGGLQVKCFVTNGQSAGIARYFTQSRRPQPFFNVSPLIPDHADRLVHDVEQALRKWAGVV